MHEYSKLDCNEVKLVDQGIFPSMYYTFSFYIKQVHEF